MATDPFAAELTARLEAAIETRRDPDAAAAMAAYMRDQFEFAGIPTPARRNLSRTVTAGMPAPTPRQLVAVLRSCWARPEREYQYFACDYAQRHVRNCPPAFLTDIRWCVTRKSWWDTVDALAHVTGALVVAHPGLVVEMDRWAGDPNLWVARVAILHQMGYKARTDTDRLFGYCTQQADHPDFFIRKAIGWALREYSKTDPGAVARYVESMGDRLSPLSKREALKRIKAG
jgi:3-methyladenine DNA glycosylase AlkD